MPFSPTRFALRRCNQPHPMAAVNTESISQILFVAKYSILASAIAIFSISSWAQSAPQPAPAQGTAAGASVRPGEAVTLNFVGAEIEAVARAMATLTGRNVVVDPRVKGQITLSTERPVGALAALNQFAAALRLQGFALVESGGLYKVVPEADAKLQVGAVNAGSTSQLPSAAVGGNQVMTHIFGLQHENANNLVPVLRPLIGPNHTINVNPGTNSLIITDYADNLQRLGRIIAALDVANASDVDIIPLKYAVATDLVALVQRLIEGGPTAAAGQGQADTSFKTTILAEPRSNSLVVRTANPARQALVRALAEKLDRPTSDNASGNIHVVYLKNADAVQLATTLRAAMSAEGGMPGGGTPNAVAAAAPRPLGATAGNTNSANAPLGSSQQPSTGGQIQADPATNSLIITAPEPQYRQMRAVIDMLDTRRAQVFVESLIAEVNADKAAEFGIQWQGPLGNKGDNVIGLLGSNFGAKGNNIVNLATGAASGAVTPGAGLNFGLVQQQGGVYVLGFLARFLEQTGEGNVLSTPNLLTLDNEEAKIVIGQNVPFVTGQFTNTGATGGTVNPFQTIERKDVGLTLRVKPQISENGTVKLSIFQEVSSVLASSVNTSTGLITNKRSIESNVLVEDGQIVVLGGLLQDEYSGNVDQVPGLGDIPVLGNLFKSQTRGRKKTNLMVFLRPVVVRDARQTTSLSQDRYERMRGAQQQAQPNNTDFGGRLLGIQDAPVLPERMNQALGGQAPNPAPPPAASAVPSAPQAPSAQ
ncbi:MAG: type II secretion system secretin GspD [Burkholderiaceae bacterium]|nr:type II secretion system secretin GspD [Burkholderiaceae bacterium]